MRGAGTGSLGRGGTGRVQNGSQSSSYANVARGAGRRGGRVRDGGGGGVRGSRVVKRSPNEEQHFLVIYLTKVTPTTFLKLTEDEISTLCLDLLKIPKEWITGVSQSLTDLTKVKIQGRFDLKEYEVEEVEIRPGEILGSSMANRETNCWVYFYGADIALEGECITEALKYFGEFSTEVQEVLGPQKAGRLAQIWSGDRRVGMTVRREIPQHIFVDCPGVGTQMVKVVYSAQKYKCGWCGKSYRCKAGKNGKRCRESGAKRVDREAVWYKHKFAAAHKQDLEDTDAEDERMECKKVVITEGEEDTDTEDSEEEEVFGGTEQKEDKEDLDTEKEEDKNRDEEEGQEQNNDQKEEDHLLVPLSVVV